jgi:hypothetical protein
VLRNAHSWLRLKQQQLRSKDGNGNFSCRNSEAERGVILSSCSFPASMTRIFFSGRPEERRLAKIQPALVCQIIGVLIGSGAEEAPAVPPPTII